MCQCFVDVSTLREVSGGNYLMFIHIVDYVVRNDKTLQWQVTLKKIDMVYYVCQSVVDVSTHLHDLCITVNYVCNALVNISTSSAVSSESLNLFVDMVDDVYPSVVDFSPLNAV